MNAFAKLSSTLLVAAVLIPACGADRPAAPTEAAAPPSTTGDADELGTVANATRSQIAADEPVHDFGTIAATDAVEHVFRIRNVGGADLEIERVQRT